MNPFAVALLPMLVVRIAGLLIPRRERGDWVAEWAGELWAVQESGTDQEALDFSLGAFRDALLLRRDRVSRRAMAACGAGSMARCILGLAVLAFAGITACLWLPGARATVSPLPYRNAGDLVLITRYGDADGQQPRIRLSDYREWTTNTAGLYSQLAYFAPETVEVHLTHHRSPHLRVAVATGDLLDTLQPADGMSAARLRPASGARLVLSRSAWSRWYRSDPGIFGREVTVRGQTAVVAGVMPKSDWRLPVLVDALLLEDPLGMSQLAPTLRGFVVARIRDSAFPPPRAGWRSMVETRGDVVYRYGCLSLDSMVTEPLFTFGCCVLLALLVLPAITALSLGDYPLSREPLRRLLVVRRWLFLALKFALVLAIVSSWSTAIAFGLATHDLSAAAGLQALLSFVPLLFGFRWILQDQRSRCPVCLRRLSNPARVGQASCNFLSWCGIELICASGHGLLHIPELPTSWFGTQRWLCLDSSWLCLFAEPTAPVEMIQG